MRKLLWSSLFIGFLFCVRPVLCANGPADSSKTPSGVEGEKKKQDSLRAVRLEKVAAFRAAYPGVELHPNPVTGVPEHLYGDLSKGQTQSEPAEAAYEFLEQNKDLYGIASPRDELKVKGVAKDQYGAVADLKQVYKGVNIYQAEMSVHFTPAGKLKGITGGFAQIPELSPTPAIDSLSAIGIAKRDLNYTAEDERKAIRFEESLESKRSPVNAWLLVAPYNNQYHLVWIIGLSRIQPYEAWEYWVDAHSGAILNKKSALMMDVEPSTPNSAPPPMPGKKDKNPVPKPRN